MIMNQTSPWMVPVSEKNPCILKNVDLCSSCGHCFSVCQEEIGVAAKFLDKIKEKYPMNKEIPFSIIPGELYPCLGCGQCSAACPEEALIGRPDYKKVKEEIKDPDKIVIFSTSPSVRVGFADGFGKEAGTFSQDEMVGALKMLGADYVLDVTFSADLTIMEEGSELLKRILTSSAPLPQFTSCCPAWVRYMEQFHADKLAHISSAKSPIGMQGALIKTYFAHKRKLDPEKIISVAVTPCTAKKGEIARRELKDAGDILGLENLRDNDYVITTKELVAWCKEEGIHIEDIKPASFDSILGEGSGAGMIFGNTGGVMEAALRTLYKVLEKKEPPEDFFSLEPVRGMKNRKVAQVEIAGHKIKACIIYGTKEAERFLAEDMSDYHFVEVMTCPGGCISGAGQPNCGVTPVPDAVRQKRIDSLYRKDQASAIRNSIDNPEIAMVYKDFLKEPLSMLSEKLLHTSYHKR